MSITLCSVPGCYKYQMKNSVYCFDHRLWDLDVGTIEAAQRAYELEINLKPINKESSSMTKKEYLEFHKMCCDKMHAITTAKNADYTGEGDDPFANFSRVESMGIATTEQGFLTRILDKVCRITTFAKKGVLLVKDESVEDTLLDLANYAILMAAYIKSKRLVDNANKKQS